MRLLVEIVKREGDTSAAAIPEWLRRLDLKPVEGFQPVPMSQGAHGTKSVLFTLEGPENTDLDALRDNPEVLGVYPDMKIEPF